jgi:hypothetical protein
MGNLCQGASHHSTSSPHGRIARYLGVAASGGSFENIGNSLEVIHEKGVLTPYEVCPEQVHLLLQQAVEWFRPFRTLAQAVEQPSSSRCPGKICCLRFYSAARFRDRLFVRDDRECYDGITR